jgi:chromosome segregation ATPase
MTELAKAYKVISEREEDIKLAGQIGQMTCEENVRLEGVVAELSASLQAELDRTSELERKCSSLRSQCDELAQHNLALVEEQTKGHADHASEEGTLTEFFEAELGKDNASGDVVTDLAAFKKHLSKQRRQQKTAMHALEDTMKGLQDEQADLLFKLNEAQRERDTLRVQREANEKTIEELQTKLLDKDMEMMVSNHLIVCMFGFVSNSLVITFHLFLNRLKFAPERLKLNVQLMQW